jgi:hypothetical protein
VRRALWQLLNFDPDARMRPLELRHEQGNDLALAAHRPEPDYVRIVVARAAAGREAKDCNEEERPRKGTQPARDG